MPFRWSGLILAPLLMPVTCAVLLVGSMGGPPMLVFLLALIAGCVVSYGVTVVLFLPCLYLLSQRRPLTYISVSLLGLLLGAGAYVPVTLMLWKGSGPDSGPPTESFLTFFARWSADPLTAVFPLAGLITAALYWWLVTRRSRSVPAHKQR